MLCIINDRSPEAAAMLCIKTDFLLFPVTELWFIMHNIAVDGCRVLLIGSQFESDAVSCLRGENNHGWFWGSIDNELMGDHVLTKLVIDKTFVGSCILFRNICDLQTSIRQQSNSVRFDPILSKLDVLWPAAHINSASWRQQHS